MTKKLVLFVVLAVLFLTTTGQADPIFFGTAKVILDKGSENGYGVGGNFDIGLPLGDRVILRGTYDAYKAYDGTGYDNAFTGLTVMSYPLIDKVFFFPKVGLYLTGEGGLSKVTGMEPEFATLSSMGLYSAVGTKTKLWLGGGYSSVADEGQMWSITLALSIEAGLE